jgi:hypothetical protein
MQRDGRPFAHLKSVTSWLTSYGIMLVRRHPRFDIQCARLPQAHAGAVWTDQYVREVDQCCQSPSIERY